MKKKNNKKDEIDFIAIASHQLRGPLAVVKGYLAMILDGDFGVVEDKKLKTVLKSVYQANERLVRLVDNLLEISQMDKRVLKLKRSVFDLAKLIREVVAEVKPIAINKSLILSASLPRQKFLIKADELMLRQILFNLLDNAIKYTQRGRVKISLECIGKKARVIILDTGPGLDHMQLKGIFDKFERRDVKDSSEEGFGLGLYASKLIIQAHKGKIWAETRGKKSGFKVIFELPIN